MTILSFTTKDLKRQYIPYEVGRYVHLPGHHPVGFLIELLPEALTMHGVLKEISHIFTLRNISILHFKMSRPILGKPIYILLFADIEDERDIEYIKQELGKIKLIKEVKVVEPISNGFTIDNFFFPLTSMGQRVVILRKSLYEGMIKRLREEFGSGYEAVLYYIGIEMGREFYQDCLSIAGNNTEKICKVFEELFRAYGFGVLKIVNITPKTECVIRVYESFECELFKKRNRPSSHLVRGILVGWFSSLYNLNYDYIRAIETTCIAMGDEYCEFVISVTRE